MKAVGITAYGGPEALQQVELPDPHARSGQVRVQVMAAAVNPADVMLRDGSLADWYDDANKPFIPGMDIAGVVDEIGTGVDPALGLSIGQAVVGIVDNHGAFGGYSEYVALPAASVTAAPAGKTIAEAATFLMPALTARAALDNLALPEGSSLLVVGAAGGVGRHAVALAHADGLRVAAVASRDDEALVRGLGADVFIARGVPVSQKVKDVFAAGVDAVFDNTTAPESFLPLVREGGKFLSPRGLNAEPGRRVEVVAVNVRDRVLDHAAITGLREQVEAGALPVGVAATFAASQAVEAHRVFGSTSTRGRVVLLFNDASA